MRRKIIDMNMKGKGKPLKEGDVLFSIPVGAPSKVRIGYQTHAFLRFCGNHSKPFGFKWQHGQNSCPRCGNGFTPDQSRSFVMITTGYTVTHQFINGVEVSRSAQNPSESNDVLEAEFVQYEDSLH